MALTIEEQLETDTLYPVYNPIEYLVSSSDTTPLNFKIVVEVFRDPSGDNEFVGRLRCDVRPSTNQILVNVAELIDGYLTENITSIVNEETDIYTESSVFEKFKVNFREYYGNPPTAQGTQVSGNTVFVYNGAFKYRDRFGVVDNDAPNWKTTYIETTTTADTKHTFLHGIANYYDTDTGAQGGLIPSSPNQNLNWMPLNVYQTLQLRWRHGAYDKEGVGVHLLNEGFSVAQTGYTDDYSSPASLAIRSINLTPDNLSSNADFTATIALSSSHKYMVVFLYDPEGDGQGWKVRTTPFMLYKLEHEECSNYDTFEIVWLNHLGGFDSYLFQGRSTKNDNIKRQTYQREVTNISGTSIVHNMHEQKTGTHHTSLVERFKIQSKNIPEWLHDGMRDLVASPLVYWKTNGVYVQIAPIVNSFEYKTSVGDKVFNFGLEFELNHNERRQRI